jgi:FkbH-like protein
MRYYIYRNNTIENLFGNKDVEYSGYDDVSYIPKEAECYIWFYQVPFKFDTNTLQEEVSTYLDKFQLVYSQIPKDKNVIVFTLYNLFDLQYTNDDFTLQEEINSFNRELKKIAKESTNIKVLEIEDFLIRYNREEWIDWKYYFISQMSINPKLALSFKKWFKRKEEEIALKRKKCLVLDLDNTLWGGVLGEDGIDGIKIGGDYPGKAFLYFQEALVELSKRGIILTICSKNNEEDVLEAWEKNPFIVLKQKYISAYRINWNNKADNIKELSEELNIGLDSFVFVDDNPTERELIRQMLPMVEVPEFPEQPYELPEFFRQLVDKYFRIYSITEEDKKKTEQYQANAKRSNEKKKFTDIGEYIKSLDIKIEIQKANEFNIPRIAQMSQKTNQFNLTTKRYTDADIKSFLEQGYDIYCISVSDKFGDNGITGEIIIREEGKLAEIDTLLLSCRILGKGIEEAFIKRILAILKDKGIEEVKAKYIPTIKNSQVKDFYEKVGFEKEQEEDGIKNYIISLKDKEFDIKPYYKIELQ